MAKWNILCPQRYGLDPASRRWENQLHRIGADGHAQGSPRVIEVVQSAVVYLNRGSVVRAFIVIGSTTRFPATRATS
jgi:hypothetical protein